MVKEIGFRKFGVEIECCIPAYNDRVEEALKDAGIRCGIRDYDHRVDPYWKISTDNSVHSNPGDTSFNGYRAICYEIKSPILCYKEGARQLEIVCRVIKELGGYVNESCGLHVHHSLVDPDCWDHRTDRVGGDGIRYTPGEMIKLLEFYSVNEDHIDKFVKPSRRDNNKPNYCKSTRTSTSSYYGKRMNEFQRMKKILPKRRLAMNGWRYIMYQERYYKLNLCCLPVYGTLEIRHLHGCLDAREILDWVCFGQCMLKRFQKMATKRVLRFTTPMRMLRWLGVPVEVMQRMLDRIPENDYAEEIYA